jgi:hypothetical protein
VRFSLAGDFFWSLIENYSTVNDQPFGTKANGYDGLDTVFVYNKTKVVEQTEAPEEVDRRRHHADRGQGLSPSSSIRRQMLDLLRLDGGAQQRRAQRHIKWSATYLPWEEGTTPRNSSIGGATLWVMKGQKAEEYDGVADFLAFVASPDLQLWWSKVTGYVPITNKAYEAAKKEGYYTANPTREIAILQLNRGTPTANSQGFHFGNYTQSTFALRQELEAVWANKKTPQEGLDDAVRAATRSCGSSRSCMQASTSVAAELPAAPRVAGKRRAAVAGGTAGLKRAHYRNSRLPFFLLLPQLLVLLLFFFIPAVRALVQAFVLTDPFGTTVHFVWFDNFRALFASPEYRSSVWVTMWFTLAQNVLTLAWRPCCLRHRPGDPRPRALSQHRALALRHRAGDRGHPVGVHVQRPCRAADLSAEDAGRRLGSHTQRLRRLPAGDLRRRLEAHLLRLHLPGAACSAVPPSLLEAAAVDGAGPACASSRSRCR